MNLGPIRIEWKHRARSLRLKEAVIASFTEPAPSVRARLGEFSESAWSKAKLWLDVSGLALYFYDRLVALDLEGCLPESLLKQLRQDLADNRERAVVLREEAHRLDEMLRALHIEFAFLKGVTLPPESVPVIALRNQMDLDILIREEEASRVRALVGEVGYELRVISGSTWEFTAGPSGMSTIKNLYQVRPDRALDIHLLPRREGSSTCDRLSRAATQSREPRVVALSAADILVFQGQHIFKHMCSEYTRASWVLEFWRHVCAHRDDAAFWHEVELAAASEAGASVAVGAATLLATLVFGPFAPRELTRWSMDQLPPAVCLWMQLYGKRVLFSDSPWSKLYLLLQKQLNPHAGAERRRLLFPLHLPPQITRAQNREGWEGRARRFKSQSAFSIRRLRFHLSEGARLAVEAPRWERRVAGVSQ